MVVGLLQLQRSEDAEAITRFRKPRSRCPTIRWPRTFTVQSLLLVGKTDEAAEAMQRAIELKPPRQDYLKMAGQLGRLYQRAGEVDRALEIWKQLEQSFPGDDGVRERIARIMLEEGETEGAIERYDSLAKSARSPNDKIVYALRAADLRARAGKKEQAIKEFEALLAKLRPGSYLHEDARRRIEAIFLASGDYAGLADYYQKWVGAHPEDVDAIVRLARTLSIQGRGPEALEWFEKAIERSPSDAGHAWLSSTRTSPKTNSMRRRSNTSRWWKLIRTTQITLFVGAKSCWTIERVPRKIGSRKRQPFGCDSRHRVPKMRSSSLRSLICCEKRS